MVHKSYGLVHILVLGSRTVRLGFDTTGISNKFPVLVFSVYFDQAEVFYYTQQRN